MREVKIEKWPSKITNMKAIRTMSHCSIVKEAGDFEIFAAIVNVIDIVPISIPSIISLTISIDIVSAWWIQWKSNFTANWNFLGCRCISKCNNHSQETSVKSSVCARIKFRRFSGTSGISYLDLCKTGELSEGFSNGWTKYVTFFFT